MNSTETQFTRWRGLPSMKPSGDVHFFRPGMPYRLPMRAGERVFTIGSCFAREVGTFLQSKFELPALTVDDAPDVARDLGGHMVNPALWTRLNSFSIRNSLEWALAGGPTSDQRYVPQADGLCQDLFAGCRNPLPREDAIALGRWTDSVLARAAQCRLVILTLGLSEAWFDRQTGWALNSSPSPEMTQHYPDRFVLRVVDVAENVEQLEAIRLLLLKHASDDLQIVVTVSPVPMAATFREVDVAVANSASKAILRAAAEQWARRHTNVHYFPAYEIVLGSHPQAAWCDDFRHPTGVVVNHVMQVFCDDFLSVAPPTEGDDRCKAPG